MGKIQRLAAQINNPKHFGDRGSLRHKVFAREFETFVAPWIASLEAQGRFEPRKGKTLPSMGKGLNALITALENKARNHDAALWSLQQAAYFEPDVFSRKNIRRLENVFGDHKEFSYFLNILSQHPRTRAITRAEAERLLNSSDRFVLRQRTQKFFSSTPRNILLAHTVKDGMGDELIRMVPLLRALLEAHPQHQFTVLSHRPHLYDHPRLAVFPFTDLEKIHGSGATKPFDVVICHTHPEGDHEADRADQMRWLTQVVQQCSPQVHIVREKGRNRFTFSQVMFQGRDYVDVLRLGDISYFQTHVYEPGDRLCAELGLPLQFPSEKPTPNCPLTTKPYAPAQESWAAMAARFRGHHPSRPIWLVNPFGGGYKEKGFCGRNAERGFWLFREHLAKLVDAGNDAVVMPNHQPWGRPQTVRSVLRALPPALRAHTAVGPDPLHDMRLIKHWVAACDGVVAVEGGLIHMAHVLGKPFRVLLGDYSGESFWLPFGGLSGVAHFSQ